MLGLAFRYAGFAALATLANLGSQAAVGRFLPPDRSLTLAIGMAIGTAVGLVVKYQLDRRWIFAYRAPSLSKAGGTFALYTATGVLTTALFWGVEWGFHLAFGGAWRYVGGALALAFGYWAKYLLDRRYVF